MRCECVHGRRAGVGGGCVLGPGEPAGCPRRCGAGLGRWAKWAACNSRRGECAWPAGARGALRSGSMTGPRAPREGIKANVLSCMSSASFPQSHILGSSNDAPHQPVSRRAPHTPILAPVFRFRARRTRPFAVAPTTDSFRRQGILGVLPLRGAWESPVLRRGVAQGVRGSCCCPYR